jgi:uncharacterized protein (DUF1800 family)
MAAAAKIDWDAAAAAHLMRRAGFGGTPEEAEELAALGLEGAVTQVLAAPAPGAPPPVTDPAEFATRRRLQKAQKDGSEDARQAYGEFNRQQKRIFEDVRFWWLNRMRSAPHAVREKLTLFWHGHFATSQAKVKFNHLMLRQNQTLRDLGVGRFPALCRAMVSDPAMLEWLDGRQNQGKSPNENFAREVMELFTLGEGHYSEEDIREAARAFSGWTVRPEDGEPIFRRPRHDDGIKRLLGKSGPFGADEAVEIICEQPRCAEFLAAKLWEFYGYRGPEPALVQSLAGHFRNNKLETGKLLQEMFTRPEFYSARARAAQIKSPVQWLVQASRETGRQLLPPGLALPLSAELGQSLFAPPSVKGWDGGTSWINSATLIRRSNTAKLFAVAAPPLPVETATTMNTVAWATVAPEETRIDEEALQERLVRVFLAAPPGAATGKRLAAVLADADFPCADETVRDASVVLLGSPEYQLT